MKPMETEGKTLLMNLPFWSPLIPAMGIAALKGFLQGYGFRVAALDAAAETTLLEFYNRYFDALKEMVPLEKRGNFFNIGHDVLRNHLVAGNCNRDETEYKELVKQLVYQTYFCESSDAQISGLNRIVAEFYTRLQTFILKRVETEKPSLLGLTAHSGNLGPTDFVFRIVKEKYPHIKTVMGGSIFFNHLAKGHPDLDYYLRTAPYIDKVIIGKGEVLLLKYLRGQLPENQRVYTREDLDPAEDEAYTNHLPDLSDFDLQKYFYLATASSESCPFRCSFCNFRTFFGEYKKRDPRPVVKEMTALQERYGHRLFFMNDALLNLTITDLSRELIKTDRVFYLDGYFMVDRAAGDIENTMLWRRAGFYRARMGIESGSPGVLEMMDKKITPDMIKAAVSALAYAGIKTTTYWVIGHPGETEEDFQKTLGLLEELKNDIWEAECNPFTYFFMGQGKGEKWAENRVLLYPETARHMLITQTWILDCQPDRQEIYDRVNRFVRRCRELDIPNPYSAGELYKADVRWEKLHKNAVPTLVDLVNENSDGDERKKVKKFITLQNKTAETGDFDF